MESTGRGVRTIGHGGDWRGFRTYLSLVPEADLGIFLSMNSAFGATPVTSDDAGALQNANLFELLYESIPPGLRALLLLPLASLVLSLPLPWFAWRAFPPGRSAPLARLHYWGLTAAAWLCLLLARFWNLLGFRY